MVPSRLQQTQVHVRGTLESADAQTLVVKDRSGKSVRLARPAGLAISEVYPIALGDIAQGSFVGTSAEARADGTLQAIEVHVFPESSRGTGEGHYPWDLQQERDNDQRYGRHTGARAGIGPRQAASSCA